jgi:hypothetical protein
MASIAAKKEIVPATSVDRFENWPMDPNFPPRTRRD